MVVAFIAYFQRLFAPLNQLTNLASLYTRAAPRWTRSTRSWTRSPRRDARGPAARARSGRGRIEGVSFSYDGKREVITTSTLFPAGRITAIVGHNGAGKSTLVSLTRPLLRPVRGRVAVDGTTSATDPQASLRRASSYSLQDTNLLTGTVRANMRLAKADATDEEIDQTLADLGGLAIVRRLPDGLDTKVGPSGDHLSAGQRPGRRAGAHDPGRPVDLHPRRVHVGPGRDDRGGPARGARAPPRWAHPHRHRPPPRHGRRADHIVVLEQGRVIEQGDHDALMRAGGAYASLQAESRRLRVQAA